MELRDEKFNKASSKFEIRNSALLSGFTLIEIIIVVGITAVLASMVLTYTSTSRDQVALYIEQAKLAQSISRAKAMAITTLNRPSEKDGSAIRPCAYGIHFDYPAQTYTTFSYSSPKCVITPADLLEIGTDCSVSAACEVKTEKLPLNVKIVGPEGPDAIEDPAENVLFIPPDPKTWIWKAPDDQATSTSAHVALRAGKMDVVIGINEGGQITF